MKTEIFEDYSAFFKRADKTMNGVTAKFATENPNYENVNSSNEGCWNCSDCSYCSGCSDCSYCLDKTALNEPMDIPIIEGIHAKILEACEAPLALKMDVWHTCETTHCRAGWVVTLAGGAGKKLEAETSTIFAAMQIYAKSSPDINVSPVRFYDTNEKAMEDIKRCAELEKS